MSCANLSNNMKIPNSTTVRILFCEAGSAGGSVRRLQAITTRLNRQKYYPMLIAYSLISKRFEDYIASSGLRFVEIGVSPNNLRPEVLKRVGPFRVPTLFGMKYLLKSLKAVLLLRPRIIYLNNTPYCHLPMIAIAICLRVPIICHMRDAIQLTKIEKAVLKFFASVVVLSRSHKAFYHKQGIQDKKMVVIYNGIDDEEFRKSCNRYTQLGVERVIAFTAILSARKRWLDALTAIEIVRREYSNFQLLIIGDGQDRKNAESVIKLKGLSKHVIITGFVSDVAEYLSLCSMGLMISDREGMPNVILEYMAMGLAVIATELPGVDEMVIDGKTGYIIPVGAPEVLADKILHLILNEKECRQMGHEGQNMLKLGKFSVQQEIFQIQKMLDNVAGNVIY